jgi:Zn-dependent peptidase ImmA (M78 family)
MRVAVAPSLLSWARVRAGLTQDDLAGRFKQLAGWESGEVQPTLKQLQVFADAVYVPVGTLLLDRPPTEELPLPDYRTFDGDPPARPSPDLLDTILAVERRQEWYREYLQREGGEALAIVGSTTVQDDAVQVGTAIRDVLGYDLGRRTSLGSWTDALRVLAELAEAEGILVMVSGIVGSNTHRVLRPEEFRGLSLVDRYAPAVFVNGADTKAAQIFTLAHELAHVWLGESSVDNATIGATAQAQVERWCNAVAAEILVPADALPARFDPRLEAQAQLQPLARYFRVSTLAVLGRLRDLDLIDAATFWSVYSAELVRVLALKDERGGAGGGNFYNTTPVRVSKTLTRAILSSTLEGNTLYTEAFDMLGIRKTSTFNGLVEHMGVG